MRKAASFGWLPGLAVFLFSPLGLALTPGVQSAINDYILETKSGPAAPAGKQLAELKHDIDDLETRLLPAILMLNRAAPLIDKRSSDIDALEKYMASVSPGTINPYTDPIWLGQVRSQALAVCCAIRAQPSLMREVQDNLVNGLQPLSEASLLKIAELAQRATVKAGPAQKESDETDEIVPSRPFVSRPKDDEGPRRKRGNSRGIISGLPDLQPDPAPAPPPLRPTPAPALPPVSP